MKHGEDGSRSAPRPAGQVLTMSDVCNLLSVAPSTIYSLLKNDQKFPQGAVIGKSRRWLRTDIEAWVVGKCRGEATHG